MKYVERECVQCERMLLKARSLLVRCAFARWQVDRLQACDKRIDELDLARADYERLKARFAQARDHHRALRLRLRRQYYAHLRLVGAPPSQATGIEGKVQDFLQQASPSDIARELQHTLALATEAEATALAQTATYCDAHHALQLVIEEAKDEALSLERQALALLSEPMRASA